MPDWTKSMQQTYEFRRVDPITWKDESILTNVIDCTITRDSSKETLYSASLTCTEDLGECYIRIYLRTAQLNDSGASVIEYFPLATVLVQTSSRKYDGAYESISLDAYSPLLELKDSLPPLGYTVEKGANTLDMVFFSTRDNCRAPVSRTIDTHVLHDDFVANAEDNWLTCNSDLLYNAKYRYDLDELGQIIFAPVQDRKSLTPMYVFNDDNSSILLPEITDSRDLYGIPNVLEMTYSSQSNEYWTIRVVNDDPNSIISTVSRGREVIERVTSPNLTGNPTREEFEEYAVRYLKNLSTLEHELSFSHGYYPLRVGECVLLNYQKANIINVRAVISSQSISCGTGCVVDCTATYTEELWSGEVTTITNNEDESQ